MDVSELKAGVLQSKIGAYLIVMLVNLVFLM